ncbi:HD domain-containing phosphohydrolase [Sneathiella sp. HT1-7]|uniref:HD domain-containing phosphohydrolase n=1 Tax=Sneathiella sp. HT1-7 TaxID=2887192 RepID=UPI001D13AF87|nr:HD domain-containing phosphohydrolase [Sneathiella sp. HT1-7]MCC3304506.1 PAS domain-containing protein [Sneathiella sp. HT1-7]
MSDNQLDGTEKKSTYKALSLGVLLLMAVVVAGIWGTFKFVEEQRSRDLRNWEVRLGIVADSRAASVDDWLRKQEQAIGTLANNASLQVYLTQLVIETAENGNSIAEVPEAGYLINLLNNQAVISGFWEPEEPQIRANVARPGRAGIGLTDATGKLLVSSGNMPPMNPTIRAAMAKAGDGEPALIDLYEGINGDPTMGFVWPIYAVQDEGSPKDIIGYVVGLRTVETSLFPLLFQPGDTLQTAENYLVRKDGKLVQYISPLADGTLALARKLSAQNDLAAAFVIENPGSFELASNYLGSKVLVTGRALTAAPWFLVRTVSEQEALAETDQRLSTMLGIFILLIFAVAGTVVAVWRHGTSLRAAELAVRYKGMAEQLRERSEFLKIVTDQQPTSIAVFDAEDKYTFANSVAAEDVEISQDEMIGKKAASVLGPEQAREIIEMTNLVRQDYEPRSLISRIKASEESAADRVIKSDFVPLRSARVNSKEVLTVFQDISDVVVAQERRESVLRTLVSTLVAFVDRRDPYSADQSRRVAKVAVAIAEEMGAPDELVRTVDIAGNLMNIGKILVSPEILTKTKNLTKKEMEIIRNSLVASADLLDEVDFDLPVAATLRQLQENFDGSGQPNGLVGMEISEPARIIAVANAFVGMVSPRAYRSALSFSAAVKNLLEDADTRYDRRMVSALINYLENRGGRESWKYFSENVEKDSTEGGG